MADEINETATEGNAGGQVEEQAVDPTPGEQSQEEAGEDLHTDQETGHEGEDEGRPSEASGKTLLDDAPEEKAEEGDGSNDQDADGSFEIPEGMTLDQAALDEALPVMKGLNLNHEQQQQLVSLYAQLQQKAATDAQAGLKTKQRAWREEVQQDPEHGKALGDAKRALAAFGDKDFNSMVKSSWLGDHPGMIRFLAAVGKTLKDDTFEEGSQRPSGERRAEDVLFDDMFNQS